MYVYIADKLLQKIKFITILLFLFWSFISLALLIENCEPKTTKFISYELGLQFHFSQHFCLIT